MCSNNDQRIHFFNPVSDCQKCDICLKNCRSKMARSFLCIDVGHGFCVLKIVYITLMRSFKVIIKQ